MQRANGCPFVVKLYGYEEIKKRNGTSQLWVIISNQLLKNEFLKTNKKIGMEFCDGGSLRGYFAKHSFQDNHVAVICKHALLGLDFLHKKNIVHRDIKADNLLWTSKGIIKIGDLGTAFDKSKERVGEESINGSVTKKKSLGFFELKSLKLFSPFGCHQN